jgi:regulatory protein
MLNKPKPKNKKAPRKITESSLRNIAIYYLQRFASSKENLKLVLKRRVMNSARYHDIDIKETSFWIEALVKQLAKSGMVDDQVYAEGKMRALFRHGVSPKKIAQRLTQKGVNSGLVQQVMNKLHTETPNPNLSAAKKLVKRRRLGPYRQPDKREERKDKDLATVARAGFDFQTACKVIYAVSIEELEKEL